MSSAWEIKGFKEYPPLEKDKSADVCIVGGGLAGAWAAYMLAKAGKGVVLLEKGKIGQAATMHTTAFITQSIDTSLAELVSIFGEAKAKLSWQAGADAIELIEQVIKEEGIECEFEHSSVYIYADTEDDYKLLKEEHVLAEKFGFKTAMRKILDSGFENAGALEIEGQAKYHPEKFLKGLVEAAEKYGAEIFEHSEATEIKGNGPVEVVTKGGASVKADASIIATYQPFNNPWSVFMKKGMYVSYVYELSTSHGAVKEGMYIDLKNPYHYMRVDKMSETKDRIIVGGEDLRKELSGALGDNQMKALKEFIDKTFPELNYSVESKWSGWILEPSDGEPLIGLAKPGEYVASAFSGNGMTYAAISGKILSDLILNKKNEYQELFDPKRPLSAKSLVYKAHDYIEEFFGGAAKDLF